LDKKLIEELAKEVHDKEQIDALVKDMLLGDKTEAGPARGVKEREITVRLDVPREEEGATVRTVLGTIFGRSRFIVIMVLCFAVLGAGAAYAYVTFARDYTGLAAAIIMFGFPEAEEGLDPHGMALDANVIRSPYVIGKALDNLGLRERGFSAEGVRANMTVAAVTPHDALDRIMLIRDSAERLPERLIYLEEVFHHSTQFVVSLYRGDELSELSGYEIVELLNEIIASYVEHFIDTYNAFRLLDVIVGHFDPSEYDFFEVVHILRGTVNNMLSYTEAMRLFAPDFRSPTTQMTFGDIWTNLNLLNTIEISRVSALVHVNNMSRNRARSANIIEYNIGRMEVQRAIALANAEDALFLITDVYQHEQWVFGTGVHEVGEHLLTVRATEVYDELIRDIQHYRRVVNRLDQDIAFYRERLANLRAARNPADPNDVRFVEQAIPELFVSLQNWENIINQTVEDYLTLELYRDAVRVLTPADFRTSFNAYRVRMALIVLAAMAIGGFLAVLVALYQGEAYARKMARH